MMNTGLISVIIPVYNVERYVKQCLDSVIGQNNRNLEIIVIDDGSVDCTAEICDAYASKDSRIKVIHQKNAGVAAARNVGLSLSSGKWVYMIDGDDWISPDFLDIEPNLCDADIIVKRFHTVDENGNIQRSFVSRKNSLMTNKKCIAKYFVNDRCNSLWDKVISRKLIGISKFEGHVAVGEDFLFFFSLIVKASKIAFSDNGFYYYRWLRENSAMSVALQKLDRQILNVELIIDFMGKYEGCKDMALLNGTKYRSWISFLYNNRDHLNDDQKHLLKNEFAKMKWGDLKYVSFKVKIGLIVKKIISNFI